MRIELRSNDELVETNPPGLPPGARMTNHTDRSGTTLHGWSAVALGSLFAGVGLLVAVLAALGKIKPSGSTPPWLVLVCGGIFAAAGLWMMAHGFAGLRRVSRSVGLREANPRETWIWDHSWDAHGSPDDSGRTIGRVIVFAVFMSLLLIPFNWISYVSGEGPVVFRVLTGLFDLAVVGAIAWAGYLIARRMKYGVAVLRFRRFPFLIGDEVEVMLPRSGPLAALEQLEATLRCVQERYEVTRRKGKRQSTVVCYEVWKDTRCSESGDGRRSTARDFTWRFAVPAALPGTSLSVRPPRYWELEVRAEMPGVDYRAVFLVPVYEDVRERRARLAG